MPVADRMGYLWFIVSLVFITSAIHLSNGSSNFSSFRASYKEYSIDDYEKRNLKRWREEGKNVQIPEQKQGRYPESNPDKDPIENYFVSVTFHFDLLPKSMVQGRLVKKVVVTY